MKLNSIRYGVANTSQAALFLICAPIYISKMGADTFGVISIFLLLQSIFFSMDVGINTILIKATAEFRRNQLEISSFTQYIKFAKLFFIYTTILATSIFLIFGPDFLGTLIGENNRYSQQNLNQIAALLFTAVFLRWYAIFQKSFLMGFEKFVPISWIILLSNFIRFPLIIPFLGSVEEPLKMFFQIQIFCSILELFLYQFHIKRLFKHYKLDLKKVKVRWINIKPQLLLGTSIFISSIIWSLTSQVDKLIISTLSNLSDFGLFSGALLLSTVITFGARPLISTFTPNFLKNYSSDSVNIWFDEFRKGFLFIIIIVSSILFSIIYFAETLLLIWSSNEKLASTFHLAIQFYSIGNYATVLSGIFFVLYLAEGNLRPHLILSFIFTLIYLPSLSIAFYFFKFNGAGFLWMVLNSFLCIFYITLVMKKYLLHKSWIIVKDFFFIICTNLIVFSIGIYASKFTTSPIELLILITVLVTVTLIIPTLKFNRIIFQRIEVTK